MKYFVAAAALAGAVMAQDQGPNDHASTVYSTAYFTVTSCAPTVTNCPARSTVVSSSIVPVTTAAHTTETGAHPIPTTPVVVSPSAGGNNGTTPVVVPSKSIPAEGTTEAATKPVPVPTGGAVHSVSKPATLATSPAASVCPGISVKTISTSVTAVIPTVIYETMEVPCATSTSVKPSAGIPGTPTGGNGT